MAASPSSPPPPVGKLDRRLTGRLRKRENFAKGGRCKRPNQRNHYGEKAWYYEDRCPFCLQSRKLRDYSKTRTPLRRRGGNVDSDRDKKVNISGRRWCHWNRHEKTHPQTPHTSRSDAPETGKTTLNTHRRGGQRSRSTRILCFLGVLGGHLQILDQHKYVKTYSD